MSGDGKVCGHCSPHVAKADKAEFILRRQAATGCRAASSFEGRGLRRSGEGEGVRSVLEHRASPDQAVMQNLAHSIVKSSRSKIDRWPAGTIKLAFRKLNSILASRLGGRESRKRSGRKAVVSARERKVEF